MVRRQHHDSSQLTAALFGGGESSYPPSQTQQHLQNQQNDQAVARSSSLENFQDAREKRRMEWESSRMSTSYSWGTDDSSRRPVDKPQDYSWPQQQQQQYGQNQQQKQYNQQWNQPSYSSQQQQISSNQTQQYGSNQQQQQLGPSSQNEFREQRSQLYSQQSYQQPTQFYQQQQIPYQQAVMTPNPSYLAPPTQNGGNLFFQSVPGSAPFQPLQLPLNMPGYSSGPVYVLMSPHGGMTPQISGPSATHKISSSVPNLTDMALQSVSSASSGGSRMSYSPEPQTASSKNNLSRSLSQDNKSTSRAKWGEKGVGVGRLWDPDDINDGDPNRNSRFSYTPQWADQPHSEENVLPGAPNSRAGEKTHARGAGVVLDAQDMAERQRKQIQAQETQRIIQQQLDERRRLQEQEEEREKKEAAMWEQKAKEQREKERKELEEEERIKREKEEAEERRKQRMENAIQEAAEKARREKEEAKFGRYKKMAENNEQKSPETRSDNAVEGPTTKINESKIPNKKPESETSPKHEPVEMQSNYKGYEEWEDPKPKLTLPDLVASAQVGTPLDNGQKLALLRALGIAPEYLLSSGILEKSSFMSLLGESNSNITPIIKENGGEYIRNFLLTPTKFRTSRDFGVQCDGYSSDISYSERKAMRRRSMKRQRVKEDKETPRSSPENKPQWGKHKSERPYRKQSEKDPYHGRKFRKKPESRTFGASDGRESLTDQDSDTQMPSNPRRRRKTWDESLQESLSSDFDRSPSPSSRSRPQIKLPRGPPRIKQPLTPSLRQERLIDVGFPSSALSLANQSRQISEHSESYTKTSEENPDAAVEQEIQDGKNEDAAESEKATQENEGPDDDDDDDDKDVTVVTVPFRSTSPPVPALAGTTTFNIPEYPPGVEPPPPILDPPGPHKKTTSKGGKSHAKNRSVSTDNVSDQPSTIVDNSSPVIPKSPPIPALANRMRKSSLPDIQSLNLENEFSTDETPGDFAKKPSAPRRMSLTNGPRMDPDQPTRINSITRPSSNTSLPKTSNQRPSTPRRLPPVNDDQSSPRPNSTTVSSHSNRLMETMSHSAINESSKDPITPVEVNSKLSSQLSEASFTGVNPVPKISLPSHNPIHARKKNSADSGFSGEFSRPSSASSQVEEQLAASLSSLGYQSTKSFSMKPDDLTKPLPDGEKWIILRSLTSVRQSRRRNSTNALET